MGNIVPVLQAVAAIDPRAILAVGGTIGMTATVHASERVADPDNQEDAEVLAKRAEEARAKRQEALKKKASDPAVALRRLNNDQWRHEQKGRTKFDQQRWQERLDAEREEQQRKDDEEHMRRDIELAKLEAKAQVDFFSGMDTSVDTHVRTRGAPKKPPPPLAAPNPFAREESDFAKALELRRAGMVPAPHIVQEEERVKTAASRRRVSQSKADADPAQVVEDLLSDLESSPSLRDPPARHVRPAASGLLKGLMDDFTGADAPPKYDTPADIAKRESAARLAREEERGVFNKDGASTHRTQQALLEVFDKELHQEQLGQIRNKVPKNGPSERQLNREKRHALAVSKLSQDLMPF